MTEPTRLGDRGPPEDGIYYRIVAYRKGEVPIEVTSLPRVLPVPSGTPTDPTDPADPTDPTGPTDPTDPTDPPVTWPGFPWEEGFNEESWEAFTTITGNIPVVGNVTSAIGMFVDGYQYGTCLINGDAECLADELGDIVGGFVGTFVPAPFGDTVGNYIGNAVTDGIHDLFDF